MKLTIYALAALLGTTAFVQAQTYKDSGGTVVPGVVLLGGCPQGGGQCTGPGGGGSIGNVTISGNSGTMSQTAVGVAATGSTTLLGANGATSFLRVCVPQTATSGIWVRWDGGTPATSPPSDLITSGACTAWIKSTGFLPTSQINAIAATTATTVTVQHD